MKQQTLSPKGNIAFQPQVNFFFIYFPYYNSTQIKPLERALKKHRANVQRINVQNICKLTSKEYS